MSMSVITDDKGVRIWRNDEGKFPRYSIGISKKDKDGNYENMYLSVKFKKDVEVANSTDIKINNAFFSFDSYKDKDGNNKKAMYLMITDFTPLTDSSFINVPDGLEDAIPFD